MTDNYLFYLMKSIILLHILVLAVISAQYNPLLSRQWQRYSIATHCSQQALASWSCPLCKTLQQLKDFKYIENLNTKIMAYMGYLPAIDQIVIFFRGTENAINWAEDFTYYQTKYSRCFDCFVHQGFYISYLSISSEIQTAIDQYKILYPNAKILVVGSSLGAALATIGTIQIQSKYGLVSQLHTFGNPRVGNQNFAMYLKNRVPSIYRVVHNRDLVPHVPLINQNYYHTPIEVLYDQQMSTYRLCNNSGQDNTCSNSYSPNFSVTDHISYWVRLNVTQICG